MAAGTAATDGSRASGSVLGCVDRWADRGRLYLALLFALGWAPESSMPGVSRGWGAQLGHLWMAWRPSGRPPVLGGCVGRCWCLGIDLRGCCGSAASQGRLLP
jgi:hypothetical protein